MRLWMFGIAFTSAALAGGWMVGATEPIVHPTSKPAGLDAHESNGAASLLGQFRTSIASWLWLRSDLYLHNGVEMRPLTEQELAAGEKGVGSSDNKDNKIANDDSIVTVIPAKEADFRGIFGDLERATKAYKDMREHAHNDPKIAIPLFRLMTWLDPQFIPGWITGANVIARDNRDIDIALQYLQEGLSENPGNIILCTELGTMSATQKRDLDSAIQYLEQARTYALKDQEILSDDDKDSLVIAYRWLGLIYRDTGQLDKMYAALREGQSAFSRDYVIFRLLNPPPTPLTRTSQALWLKAIQASAARTQNALH